jgi:non-heme Fe2+,alpha-ketoglutarate-dependent halogenase
MSTHITSPPVRPALSREHVEQFHEVGYVKGIPVFSGAELGRFLAEYDRLSGLIPPERTMSTVNWWHKRNRFLYDLCMDPRLLDLAGAIVGPDFFLWGSQFFAKDPGDGTVVPWHQDAQYWPLTPQHAVTVFIAFTDCDRENACLQVIPGTHRGGILRHRTNADETYVLKQEVAEGEFDPFRAMPIELKAGQVSLHHDGLVHGSGPNNSARRRIGFTMRFSATEVRCDLSVWPTFQAFPARGTDRYGHNPPGVPPEGQGVPTGMMQ